MWKAKLHKKKNASSRKFQGFISTDPILEQIAEEAG